MPPKHFVSSQDLTKQNYDEMLRRGMKFIKEGIPTDLFTGKVVSTLFLQPSTRTMMSFQSAMIRGGGGWIGVVGVEGLSMEKGETLEDTIINFGAMSDVIVMRHPEDDSATRAAKASLVPIINGGSGSKEHAVGAVMMLVAVAKYIDKPLDNLKVGIYGTPQINRATKSMLPVMGLYGMDVVIDDLGEFPVPEDVAERAKANGLKSLRYDKLDNFIGDVDVLFVTRGMQKGIIENFPKEKEELILERYTPINTEHMKKLRKDALLFMIMPRIFEVEKEVDSDPRVNYTKSEPYTEAAAAVMSYMLGINVD